MSPTPCRHEIPCKEIAGIFSPVALAYYVFSLGIQIILRYSNTLYIT